MNRYGLTFVARLALLTLALLTLAACAVDSDRFGRNYVSPRLQERTGLTLGPELAPGTASLPDSAVLADGINVEEAITIALWNNPTFLEALAELGVSRAALVQAGLLANPQLSLLLPVGARGTQTTLTAPLESLWLRGDRIDAAELECERVGESLVQGGLNLVRDVRLAWANLGDTRQRAKLADETITLRQAFNEFFQARLRAGSASLLECNDAKMQLLAAQQRAQQAKQEVQVAEDQLHALLGARELTRGCQLVLRDFATKSAVADNDSAEFAYDEAALLQDALLSRPDLRAAELLVEQEAERAGLAKLEALRIAGLLRTNDDGPGAAGISLAPGVQFDIPIFDWGQGQTAAAKARLDRAARRCWTIREQITQQVHEACLRVAYSQQNLQQWRDHLEPPIRHFRDVAQRMFERGDMTILTVLQQELALLDAQDQIRQATTALRNATTQLEWSIARNLQTTATQ